MTIMKYRTVRLEVVHTREVARRIILSPDQTTYLYTHWTFDFDCIYNPKATSYTGSRFAPAQSDGKFPAETDDSLRHYLGQPRGQLEVNMGNGLLIKSPLLGYTTDAKNGPIVEACDIVKPHGERTWAVHIRIHTWVNECVKSNPSGPLAQNPLLSHRWRRYIDTDQDYYTTIITEGEAIFRTDWLLQQGTYPDQYRRDLFHPIPQNCKREHIHVDPMSDGTGVRYMVIDKEQPFNLGGNCAATRLEAYQTAWYSHESGIDAAVRAVPEILGAISADPFETAGRIAGVGARTFMRSLPKYHLRCFCRAWGNRDSTRSALTSLAMGLCLSRVGDLIFRSSEMILTHDLNGKFVECDVTVKWGLETALINNIFVEALGIANIVAPVFEPMPLTWTEILRSFHASEEIHIPEGGANLTLTQFPLVTNPAPPNSSGTRGTWLGKLVAQVLSGSCETPRKPPAFAKVTDRPLY